MDPRDRADALLARARARGAFVVTPDNMTSPMDASNTQQIPGSLVAELDRDQDPDTTAVVSAATIEAAENQLAAQHHLSSATPTTRLNGDSDRTQPVSLPVGRRPRPAPQAQPEEQEVEVDGLIPTTTARQAPRSIVSRRLDGI
jgi:hypothetical protein